MLMYTKKQIPPISIYSKGTFSSTTDIILIRSDFVKKNTCCLLLEVS